MAQTDEISKTIEKLKYETIKDSLKFAGCKSQGTKPILVKNYEAAVLDVGVEKFVFRLPNDDVEATSKKLGAEVTGSQSLKEALTEKIQGVGLGSVLSKTEADMLKKFSLALGLEDESSDYAKKIEDEVMLIGMEGFLQKLNQDLLKKHCAELSLGKTGGKSELVERLMVEIFELEPLEKKDAQEKTEKEKEKQKEEAKPKETKKRKAAEPKEAAKDKKAKVDTENSARPKRKATKKKVVEEEEEEEEEKPKKQKKESTKQKTKSKAAAKEKAPKAVRVPYVAPSLTTIVKGAYDAAELHNKFNLTDLIKYAKQEGVKTSGQKKLLIKRIVNYLETGNKDIKPTKSAKPKTGNKKKAAASKKKTAKVDKEKDTAKAEESSA